MDPDATVTASPAAKVGSNNTAAACRINVVLPNPSNCTVVTVSADPETTTVAQLYSMVLRKAPTLRSWLVLAKFTSDELRETQEAQPQCDFGRTWKDAGFFDGMYLFLHGEGRITMPNGSVIPATLWPTSSREAVKATKGVAAQGTIVDNQMVLWSGSMIHKAMERRSEAMGGGVDVKWIDRISFVLWTSLIERINERQSTPFAAFRGACHLLKDLWHTYGGGVSSINQLSSATCAYLLACLLAPGEEVASAMNGYISKDNHSWVTDLLRDGTVIAHVALRARDATEALPKVADFVSKGPKCRPWLLTRSKSNQLSTDACTAVTQALERPAVKGLLKAAWPPAVADGSAARDRDGGASAGSGDLSELLRAAMMSSLLRSAMA